MSTRAIADSPIIGHGSWAKDVYYVAILRDILESNGFKATGESDEDLIPSHSHLLGAWVELGLLGGLFWIIVLIIATLAFYSCIRKPRIPATLVGFVLVSLIWDVLFSPFANSQRFMKAT